MALVLYRRVNESIKIGDDIRITVASAKGGGTRLAIEAPRTVRIARMNSMEDELPDPPKPAAPAAPPLRKFIRRAA